MPDCNNITFLNQVNKSVHTRASQSNKAFIFKSKKSCNNCFIFAAPKLWNTLPNNVTMSNNFNVFYAGLIKFIFNSVKL